MRPLRTPAAGTGAWWAPATVIALALGTALPSAQAADSWRGPWPPSPGSRGDYRGDDTYRDPRGQPRSPRSEGERSGQDPVRGYGWDRGSAGAEPPGGYRSPRDPSRGRDDRYPSNGGWPARVWGADPGAQGVPGTDRGAWGYNPWEPRGERPWAREGGNRGEPRSERLWEPPPPIPPPPPIEPLRLPYGHDPYPGVFGYPGAAEGLWPRD
jgi:hypothetical protein